MLDRVGVCAVVSASVGEGGKMLDGLLGAKIRLPVKGKFYSVLTVNSVLLSLE